MMNKRIPYTMALIAMAVAATSVQAQDAREIVKETGRRPHPYTSHPAAVSESSLQSASDPPGHSRGPCFSHQAARSSGTDTLEGYIRDHYWPDHLAHRPAGKGSRERIEYAWPTLLKRKLSAISELDVTMKITVPGDVIKHNAPKIEGRTLIWEINGQNMMSTGEDFGEPEIIFSGKGLNIDAPAYQGN